MRKTIIPMLIAFLFSGVPALSQARDQGESKEEKLPALGSIYKYSNAEWYVRGAGTEIFEYTSTGESLCVITLGIPGSIVKVPKKGEVVKVDPQSPMIYIDNVADQGLKNNNYFLKKAKGKVFILLEYKRD